MKRYFVGLGWRSPLLGTLSLLAACGGADVPISTLKVETFEVSPLAVGVGDRVEIRWRVAADAGEKLNCSLDVNGDRYADYLLTDCAVKSQSHRYQEAGNYKVELLVRDSQGRETGSSKGVEVTSSGSADELTRQPTSP